MNGKSPSKEKKPLMVEIAPENLSNLYGHRLGLDDLDTGLGVMDQHLREVDHQLQQFPDTQQELRQQMEEFKADLSKNREAIQRAKDLTQEEVVNRPLYENAQRRQDSLQDYDQKTVDALAKVELGLLPNREEAKILHEGYRQGAPGSKGVYLQLMDSHGGALTPGARNYLNNMNPDLASYVDRVKRGQEMVAPVSNGEMGVDEKHVISVDTGEMSVRKPKTFARAGKYARMKNERRREDIAKWDTLVPDEGEQSRDMGFARVSKDVYNDVSKLGKDSLWQPVKNQKDFGIDPSKFKDNFYARLYQNKETGEYVVAYRGTDMWSFSDWSTNFANARGYKNSQYDQTVAIAKELKERLGNNFYTTGHSKGGGQAATAALVTGAKGVTFNAAAVSGSELERNGKSFDGHEKMIRNYKINGDILSFGQDTGITSYGADALVRVLFPGIALLRDLSGRESAKKAAGQQISFSPKTSTNPVSLHLMDSVNTTMNHVKD